MRWLPPLAAIVAAFLAGGVVGWTVRGVEAATSPSDLTRFTADALDAYRLYVVEVRHPVEVPGDQRPHLDEWLSKRVGSPLRAPELDKIGLKLVGGRLLPGPTGATAFFMYETPSGERFTLYCGRTSDRDTALRYTTGPQNAAYYWVDGDLAYVLSGPAERDKLHEIAQAAYEQIDRRMPARRAGNNSHSGAPPTGTAKGRTHCSTSRNDEVTYPCAGRRACRSATFSSALRVRHRSSRAARCGRWRGDRRGRLWRESPCL